MSSAAHQSVPLAEALVARYQKTFQLLPLWAWPFKPAVPFVGQDYQPGGLLVYASAENLSRFNRVPAPARFTSSEAWNRYRAVYEAEGRHSNTFHPNLGIAPLSNGGLLAAALFIAEQCGLPTRPTPRAFIETIAAGNFAKYTLKEGPTNEDYIGDMEKMTPSIPFVVGELAELRPGIILLNAGPWDNPILRAAMWGACPGARFIAVPQCNATVINTHLANYHEAGLALRAQFRGTALVDWMQNLRGVNRENAWRYLAFIDETLSAGDQPTNQRGKRGMRSKRQKASFDA